MAHPSNVEIFEQAKTLSLQIIAAYEGLYSGVRGKYVPLKANVAASTIIYAYYDNARPPVATIGWGTTHYPNGKAVSINDTCTKAQADAWRIWEADQKCRQLLNMINVPINVYLFASLISATFNTGAGSAKKNNGFFGSNLRKVINSGADDKTIAKAFFKHIITAGGGVNKGLVKRRLGEARFSLGLVNDFYIESNDPRFLQHYRDIVAKKK